jgi:hypothetical protein
MYHSEKYGKLIETLVLNEITTSVKISIMS